MNWNAYGKGRINKHMPSVRSAYENADPGLVRVLHHRLADDGKRCRQCRRGYFSGHAAKPGHQPLCYNRLFRYVPLWDVFCVLYFCPVVPEWEQQAVGVSYVEQRAVYLHPAV
jgi:hypothetical protein